MEKLAVHGGKPVRIRPFHSWPVWDEHEINAVIKAVRSGKWWRGAYSKLELSSRAEYSDEDISRVELFEDRFSALHKAHYAVATVNGTAALDVSIRALGINPGDEVITTPYTFISTSTCILNNFAVPVYVDIDPETYNINADLIERAITKRTRAILPVHFSGNLADMDVINAVAQRHGLKVLEDACHSHGVELTDEKMAGTLGHIGCFSFQASKNMAGGEGGILITNDEQLYKTCFSLHHIGREEGKLWYEHYRLGWNYRMTELVAAVLLAQLERLMEQNALRMQNYNYLINKLKDVPGIIPCRLNPKVSKHSHHLVMLRYDKIKVNNVHRDRFIEALNAEGIPCLCDA
ncbi:MAG: DegT/DnrJ/EryC1/StrS family aminotransferase, partial [Patescibacteria group bacterium]|nr:DegT/DnrJ/EryC1/StrS family aminotransferase [Patescibacteria group bacterium]